jgi:TRAP-type mannitol/chloroaromatic compound transport system permease small subunit
MLNRAAEGFAALMARVSLWAGYVAAISIVLITALIGVEVIGRTLFRASTMIADEMSGYLNCAIVFLGLSYSLREGSFIRVESFYHRARGVTKRAMQWGICLVSLAFMVIVVIYMARHVAFSFERGIRSTQIAQTPLFLPQSLILVGSMIMALQLLSYLLNRMRDLP